MSIKFLVNNLVSNDTTTIIPQAENLLFPSSNIKDVRRSKVFIANASVFVSSTIVFDFGSAKDINSVAIVDSAQRIFNFESAKIELNTVDVWTPGSIPVVQALTIDYGNGWINFNWSSIQNYRYAKLTFLNSNPLIFMELSKVFIGKSTEIDGVCFSYPISIRDNNRAVVTTNRYGQKFVDEILSQKEIKAQIPSMTKEELDVLLEMIDYASYTKPIWLYMDSTNIMVDQNRISGYYYLAEDPEIVLNQGNYWSVSLSLVEGT